jgi:OOP family OmpA-OmpF porin
MKKLIMMTASMLVLAAVNAANAQTVNQDVVADERENITVNSFGNCVRTKWQAEGDACAPEVEPTPVAAPAPVPAPAPVISQEERTVYFEFDKADLTPEARTKLDGLAAHVAASSAITGAGIAGYTDQIGANDYNMALSKKRAKTVYDYVSQRVKINTQILDIRALGASAPKVDCSGEKTRAAKIACMAPDRRVEVVFQYKQ